MALPQFEGSVDVAVERVYYTGTTELHEGAVVYYTSNADPTNTVFGSKDPGVAVEVNPSTAVPALFAGVVLKESAGTSAAGFITVARPKPGQVVTVAIAIGADAGDGGVLTNSQQHLADGGAYDVSTDEFYVLYDEDNSNNPLGS
jgi:NADPH-dependent curcumin reductase CurA